ncbi:MAG TPA: DUF721 domain-containing protein [Candidatus Latescibacteria bacterium]|nr:DUF721 domain-containing protein [Candidatus Latescibacterota bacterium]
MLRPLGELIELWASSLGIERKLSEWRACSLWEEVVGEAIARNTAVMGIQGGVLVVRVRSAPWRNELFFMKPEILEKLNHRIGRKVVRDIRFVQ